MRDTPPGWPRISSALWYQDPLAAIDWLCQAFGFEVRLKVLDDEGRLAHSELSFGDGLIMVGGEADTSGHPKDHERQLDHRKSPRSLGGANSQSLHVYVDDVEAHCERARAAGAQIVSELKTSDYGLDHWTDRGYECADLEGHHWWFSQRLR